MTELNKDKPLAVRVEKDQLIISVGISTLAFAAERAEHNNPFDDLSNRFLQTYKVVDEVEFANDVRGRLTNEDEIGGSPLTYLLDKMFVAAIEDGSTAVEEYGEESE